MRCGSVLWPSGLRSVRRPLARDRVEEVRQRRDGDGPHRGVDEVRAVRLAGDDELEVIGQRGAQREVRRPRHRGLLLAQLAARGADELEGGRGDAAILLACGS
jgi:hypothetical protein